MTDQLNSSSSGSVSGEERPVDTSPEAIFFAPTDPRSSQPSSSSEIKEALDSWRRLIIEGEEVLSSLKDSQLTPEEARKFLWLIENSSGNEDPDLTPLREKLLRAATKGTAEK